MCEPMFPAEDFRQRMSGAGCEYGNGENTCTDDSDCEQQAGGVSSERTKGLRSLPSGSQASLAALKECGGSRENNEVHDQVGKNIPTFTSQAVERRCSPETFAVRS